MSKDFKVFLTVFIFILVLTGVIAAFYFLSASRVENVMTRAGEKYQFGDVQDVKTGIEMYSSIMNNRQNSREKIAEAAFKAADGYMLLSEKTKDPAKMDIARQKYRDIIVNYADTVYAGQSFLRVAHINMLQGNYDTALAELDMILTKFTDPVIISDVYNQKAEIYFSIGYYDKALYYFNRNENMNSELAVLGRAKTYLKMGNTPKAIDIYEDFIKYNAHNPIVKSVSAKYLELVYNYAFNLYSAKDNLAAVSYFTRLIGQFPENPKVENAWYWIGECYYDLKDYSRSIEAFNKVLENRRSFVKDPDALLKMGFCYFEQADYYRALKQFDAILDNFPDSRLVVKAQKWKDQTMREIKYQ